MKNLQKSLMLFMLPLILFSNGCFLSQNPSPQTAEEYAKAALVCYKTTGSTVALVDLGMNIYGELYRAGKITPEQEQRVKTTYAIYQPAVIVSIRACQVLAEQANNNNSTPLQLALADAKKDEATKDLQEARNKLILQLNEVGAISGEVVK